MILLVVLQNAYDKGSLTKGWNAARWLREYQNSRTGKRLARAIPREGIEVRYTNANPKMGAGPDSKHEPDLAHLRRRIRVVDPHAVLACGKLAEEAVAGVWDEAMIAIPHPASRVLTNALLEQCCDTLTELCNDPVVALGGAVHAPLGRRIALRQRRGCVEIENL